MKEKLFKILFKDRPEFGAMPSGLYTNNGNIILVSMHIGRFSDEIRREILNHLNTFCRFTTYKSLGYAYFVSEDFIGIQELVANAKLLK